MTLRDLLGMAFMNLWRRKLRAFLTVLGMVVGTASIVVMVSLGIGINVSYQESLEQAGSLTTITVEPQDWNKYWEQQESSSSGGVVMYSGGGNGPETVDINDKAIAKMKALPGVKAVTPILSTYNGNIKAGKYVLQSQIYGIDPAVAKEFGIELSEGEMFGSNSGSTYEMIMGYQIPYQFMNISNYAQALNRDGTPKINPMTANLKLTFDYNNIYDYGGGDTTTKKGKFYRVKVTGMIAQKDDWQIDSSAFMDIKALKKLMKENKNFIYSDSKSTYSQAWVKVDSVDNVSEVQQAIKDMGYGASSLGDMLKQVQDSTKQLRALLGAIGAVALLVAAIGIMNTMMMAIYERTKEIGVIKVLGCKMSNICGMFLAEAAYIGFFGGAVGAGISYGLGAILNKFFLASMGMRSVIPIWLSVGAVLFSAIVSMLSGLYPSIKAMKLSPLAAIRAE